MYYYHFVKTEDVSGYLSNDFMFGLPILDTKNHCTSKWKGEEPLDVSLWGIDKSNVLEYRTEEVNKEKTNES